MTKFPVLALVAFVLAACGEGDKKPAGGQPGPGAGAPPPPEVDVVVVAPGTATITQELPGRLQAVRTAQVRARVEGIVEKRLFAEGSDVKAGTPLFRIDARTYSANVASAKADLVVAKQTFDRYKPLLEMKAVSRQEYDLAEAKVKQAEAALARSALDMENAAVLAPISGRIGRALVTEGALVGKGEATPLATIEQIDPIYANFTRSNAEMLKLQAAIKAGKLKNADAGKVDLILEDGSVYAQRGTVMFSDLSVDPNTGAISLRAEFPNSKRELLPGTFVRVRLPQAETDNVVPLPQRAVQTSPQGQNVLIVDAEGKVAPRPIVTGGMSGADWIVTDGLKPGDQVIVNGLQKVRPGAMAKPVPWNPAAMPAPGAGMPAGMTGMTGMSGMSGMAAAPADKK